VRLQKSALTSARWTHGPHRCGPCIVRSQLQIGWRPIADRLADGFSMSRQRRGEVETRNYLRNQAGSRSLAFDLSVWGRRPGVTHQRFGSSSHPLQNGMLTHPQDFCTTSMSPYVLLRSARSIIIAMIIAQRKINNHSSIVMIILPRSTAIGNNTLTIRTFLFSPPLSAPPPACKASVCVFFSPEATVVSHWHK
jgi:hypothetical protein